MVIMQTGSFSSVAARGHNGFIHWTNGRNETAVSQKRFLQIKSLHPAGHQIHSDAPGDCAGDGTDQFVKRLQILRR